jgi:hypothetical protein
MALGLRAEPITQRGVLSVEEIIMDGEDRAALADLKLIPSLHRKAAFRSTSELVDQLQEQPRSERPQARFDLVENERELALVPRELAEARLRSRGAIRLPTSLSRRVRAQ